LFVAGAMGVFAGQAAAAEYKIDPAHSEVVFKVRHMGLSTVTGRFDKFEGSFDVDPKNVKATKGSLVIETASINTNNAKRDDHLRSPEFFDAAKHPQIKFVGKEVKDVNEKDSTATLVGDLTMHGVTKPVALKVKGGGIIQDGWGNDRAAFTATGKLNRFDYGLKWNNAVEAGRLVVGEEVELVLSFQGTRPSAKAAAAEAKPAKK
jgi:polyisoprenoid-binding protein YceI